MISPAQQGNRKKGGEKSSVTNASIPFAQLEGTNCPTLGTCSAAVRSVSWESITPAGPGKTDVRCVMEEEPLSEVAALLTTLIFGFPDGKSACGLARRVGFSCSKAKLMEKQDGLWEGLALRRSKTSFKFPRARISNPFDHVLAHTPTTTCKSHTLLSGRLSTTDMTRDPCWFC